MGKIKLEKGDLGRCGYKKKGEVDEGVCVG